MSKNSVVNIYSGTNRACATGFSAESRDVTTARYIHLVRHTLPSEVSISMTIVRTTYLSAMGDSHTCS